MQLSCSIKGGCRGLKLQGCGPTSRQCQSVDRRPPVFNARRQGQCDRHRHLIAVVVTDTTAVAVLVLTLFVDLEGPGRPESKRQVSVKSPRPAPTGQPSIPTALRLQYGAVRARRELENERVLNVEYKVDSQTAPAEFGDVVAKIKVAPRADAVGLAAAVSTSL
ncbi:hypothetical protein D3C72_1555890 [compost metagenome]